MNHPFQSLGFGIDELNEILRQIQDTSLPLAEEINEYEGVPTPGPEDCFPPFAEEIVDNPKQNTGPRWTHN